MQDIVRFVQNALQESDFSNLISAIDIQQLLSHIDLSTVLSSVPVAELVKYSELLQKSLEKADELNDISSKSINNLSDDEFQQLTTMVGGTAALALILVNVVQKWVVPAEPLAPLMDEAVAVEKSAKKGRKQKRWHRRH